MRVTRSSATGTPSQHMLARTRHLSPNSFAPQVCQILEAAGLWNSTIPFGDAVQPIVFHADVVDHLTQERLDAGLHAMRKAIAESVCGHIIKRGCVPLD